MKMFLIFIKWDLIFVFWFVDVFEVYILVYLVVKYGLKIIIKFVVKLIFLFDELEW